jgi:hypothetical protein
MFSNNIYDVERSGYGGIPTGLIEGDARFASTKHYRRQKAYKHNTQHTPRKAQ